MAIPSCVNIPHCGPREYREYNSWNEKQKNGKQYQTEKRKAMIVVGGVVDVAVEIDVTKKNAIPKAPIQPAAVDKT